MLVLPALLAGLLLAAAPERMPTPSHDDAAPSLAEEVRRLGTKPGVIIVSDERTITAAANLTVPKTALLRFEVGGFLSIEQGASVTINGALDASLFTIFTGAGQGNVRFGCCPQLVTSAYPQWWGSATDGTTDDTAAIQVGMHWLLVSAVSHLCKLSSQSGASYYLPPCTFQAALDSFPYDQAMIDKGMDPRGQVVFPRGVYKVSAPIVLAGNIELLGHGAVLRGIVAPAGRAMIEPPNRGVNRTDGWTIRGMRFDGVGRGSNPDLPQGGSMIGLDLTQTSYLLLEDFSFDHFHTAIRMSGGDMSANEFNGHPCMYNIFRQGNIGSVHTAITANYSITNRFHDLQIGNVVNGPSSQNFSI